MKSWKDVLLYGLVVPKEKKISTNWHPRCSLTFKSVRSCHQLGKQCKAGSLQHRGSSSLYFQNDATSIDNLPTLCTLLSYRSQRWRRQSARLQFQNNFSAFGNENFKIILFQSSLLAQFLPYFQLGDIKQMCQDTTVSPIQLTATIIQMCQVECSKTISLLFSLAKYSSLCAVLIIMLVAGC